MLCDPPAPRARTGAHHPPVVRTNHQWSKRGAVDADDEDINAGIYDLIIDNTANSTLTRTLAKKYRDKGHEAMKYIMGQHDN